jgi:glycosyltransferase involved in cell wall biosynthesis
MKIAVVSSTTVPSTLPDDPHFVTTYGSEVYNAVLVKGLADRGHYIEWYAPVKSSMFIETPLGVSHRIVYHPIKDSKGAHLQSELLEDISLFPRSKTKDILDCDFLLDMSKQNHISEELWLWHDFKRYINYKSGYMDWTTPIQCPPHYVTHCNWFAENFRKNGKQADVAKFGIPDFWCGGFDSYEHWRREQVTGEYYLFPHRPSYQKGFDKLQVLAKAFPEKTFVISTAAVFEDHKREMAALKQSQLASNLKIIDIPPDRQYHYRRRALMRNAQAVLSPFTTKDGYMDTGGLVSFESIRCGTPVIVTRSQGSTEMLGTLEGKGVEFVDDGIDSLKRCIQTGVATRPQVDNTWMSIGSYIDDYERIMEKYK